jgi:F-type H+-transporting ATPase subunit alpha
MTWEDELRSTLSNLRRAADSISVTPEVQEIGRVRRVGDGVALVEGLADVAIDEVIAFPTGVRGQVMDLDRGLVGCVLFGPQEGIGAGAPVTRTGHPPSFPVGRAVLGRVVDALGQPRDGKGPLGTSEEWPIEREAPGPLQRQPIHEPLFTGVKAIDAAIPIGRGQRELILGDRETGKTSLALDTIINQRGTDVICIYVSIGKKRSSVVEAVDDLRRSAALDHTAVVVADASDPAALRHLAPYAGATLAEWFAYQQKHVVVVYDDLTRHAEAYRDLSLTLRHPPGREAYPGDIFSVHARLLERAFKLSDVLGGGSVTALPIVETQRGNLTGFIPTNLISITDGQLYLDANLFAETQLPAIDIGLSVSRVGGDAQPATMRAAAANLRLDLGQYEDVKDFARFGAILDDATKRQLHHGALLRRILTQPERDPVPLAVQVAEFWALKEGLLERLSPEQIIPFEARLRAIAASYAHLDVQTAPRIDGDLAQQLRRWIEEALTGMGVTEVGGA